MPPEKVHQFLSRNIDCAACRLTGSALPTHCLDRSESLPLADRIIACILMVRIGADDVPELVLGVTLSSYFPAIFHTAVALPKRTLLAMSTHVSQLPRRNRRIKSIVDSCTSIVHSVSGKSDAGIRLAVYASKIWIEVSATISVYDNAVLHENFPLSGYS